MFRKVINGGISEEELDSVKYPFTDMCDEYVEKYLLPDYIAFYLATGYLHDALWESSFRQHFYSAADMFNTSIEDEKTAMAKVKDILKIKYSLDVTEEKPKLVFKELWKD